jgi:hypothetical protein
MHGFVLAVDAPKSGFTILELCLFWEALLNGFEHDQSNKIIKKARFQMMIIPCSQTLNT